MASYHTLAALAALLAALLAARYALRHRAARCGREYFGQKLGDFVMTWYTFQDNTPCNSTATASGRPLIPFVSVALPFRYMKGKGGTLDYGDKLFVKFLEGRAMPNGKRHSGWVQIDDFCGDGGQDGYCFQTVGGKKYPNVDLYIGDYTKSGTNCGATGPAGDGQELTEVHAGTPPTFDTDYGGAAKGAGKCGDCKAARREQACQWHYTPTYEPWWDSVCGPRARTAKAAAWLGAAGGKAVDAVAGAVARARAPNAADFAPHTLPTDAAALSRDGIDKCAYWARSYNQAKSAWECVPLRGAGAVDTRFNWELGADWGRFQCAPSRSCAKKLRDAYKAATRRDAP